MDCRTVRRAHQRSWPVLARIRHTNVAAAAYGGDCCHSRHSCDVKVAQRVVWFPTHVTSSRRSRSGHHLQAGHSVRVLRPKSLPSAQSRLLFVGLFVCYMGPSCSSGSLSQTRLSSNCAAAQEQVARRRSDSRVRVRGRWIHSSFHGRVAVGSGG